MNKQLLMIAFYYYYLEAAWAFVLFHNWAIIGGVWDAQVPTITASSICSVYSSMCSLWLQAMEQDLWMVFQLLWRSAHVSSNSFFPFFNWSYLQKSANHTNLDCRECSRMMVGYHQRAGTGKLTGAYRKYSTSKYGYASECKPALFLMDQETSSSTDQMD